MEDNVIDINTKRPKPLEEDEKRYYITLAGVIYLALLDEFKGSMSNKEIEEVNKRILAKIKDYATRVSIDDNEGGLPAVVFPSADHGGLFISVQGEPQNGG